MPFFCITPRAFSWYASFYFCIRFVSKFSNASFCGLYNFMEKEDRKVGTVSSYGFTSERVVQDFPLRGKAVYLHVRRRKWCDSSTGEIFSYSYDDLTAEGSKLSPELVSFLKE
uniref:ISL3 zinc-finger of transposase IS204/IS1001/IS1096/IS1165 n=1 Tax=Myoviridae sp. ctuJM17 TaxID=2825200 RepID=A0A8S5PKV2_9CAUD|nr:MAG TPA: ISL3 zinc-finger of transposase IS204/IS1001/IS1096/IS1165 [Myoviridae sp. ctuJM17]